MDVGRSCVTMKFLRSRGMSEYRRVASGRITIHWTFGSLPRMRRFFTETRPGQVETASSHSIQISSGFWLISARRAGPVRRRFAAIR